MYTYANNIFVPEYDLHCQEALARESGDLDKALQFCRRFEVAVQAGGNFGVWPKALAGKFRLVYTFEPDARNFACLAWNTRECLNVHRYQAALGERRDWCGMQSFEDQHNAGAHQVSGNGDIAVMCIDDFGLWACDLIYLDIEGSEPGALLGARRTIGMHKPVIAIEDKGLADSERREQALSMLRRMGYKLVGMAHNDRIYAC